MPGTGNNACTASRRRGEAFLGWDAGGLATVAAPTSAAAATVSLSFPHSLPPL